MYSLHSIKTLETRRIKRFPAKTFTNVGMVQRVIKNRVRAPTHHTGNKSPDTRRGSLASLAIHNPCRSRFIAFKRLCIHCTQVNILRLQDTLKPLSPSLHLATCAVKVACMCTHWSKEGAHRYASETVSTTCSRGYCCQHLYGVNGVYNYI